MNDTQAYNFPIKFKDVHYIAYLCTANTNKVNDLLNGTGLKAGLHFFGKPVVALSAAELPPPITNTRLPVNLENLFTS